jgi:hypothetical protein
MSDSLTRRSFFRRFAGVIASVAVAQGVVRSWLKEPLCHSQDYVAAWKFEADCKDGVNYMHVETVDFTSLASHVDSFIADHPAGAIEYKRYEQRDGRFVRVS